MEFQVPSHNDTLTDTRTGHISSRPDSTNYSHLDVRVIWSPEEVAQLARQTYDETIDEVILSLFAFWIRESVGHYEFAKRHVRELALDQGYPISRIANTRLRYLLELTRERRPQYVHGDVYGVYSTFPTHEVLKRPSSTTFSMMNGHTNAPPYSAPAFSIAPIPRSAGGTFPRQVSAPTLLPSASSHLFSPNRDFPPDTPDRPAPLNIRSTSSSTAESTARSAPLQAPRAFRTTAEATAFLRELVEEQEMADLDIVEETASSDDDDSQDPFTTHAIPMPRTRPIVSAPTAAERRAAVAARGGPEPAGSVVYRPLPLRSWESNNTLPRIPSSPIVSNGRFGRAVSANNRLELSHRNEASDLTFSRALPAQMVGPSPVQTSGSTPGAAGLSLDTALFVGEVLARTRARGAVLPTVEQKGVELSSDEQMWREDHAELLYLFYGRTDIVLQEVDREFVETVAAQMEA